jgi:hypothetical protein
MQETRRDGTQVLTDRADIEDIQDAMRRPETESVALHKPGSTITFGSGAQYTVQPDGSWRRLRE